MPRTPLWRSSFLSLLVACAGTPPPLPPGVMAAPALGDSLELLLTKLRHAEGVPADVELRELRISAVEQEPWRTLTPAAAAADGGRVGVIAGRRCRWREGLLRQEVERGSWYLLEGGALFAFDHQGFGPRCTSRPAFEPAAADQVALERSLMRYLSQRWPLSEIAGEERLARGLRLLARGRVEDAQYELFALDRSIAEAERRDSEQETPDAGQRERLREEVERLRPLRAQLYHALHDYVSTEGEEP